MIPTPTALSGHRIRLEPLERRHVSGLLAAAAADPTLYNWSIVPQSEAEMLTYVDTALSWRDASTAVPFAVIRAEDEVVIGSTRLWALEYWSWPAGHPRHGRSGPDACEIGYSWLAASAVRTTVNSEMKHLMLMLAFEEWGTDRVCFHTDVRNQRSRAALLGIGATFEGVLRVHRIASDMTLRDSARFSIVAADWPRVKLHLRARAGLPPQ